MWRHVASVFTAGCPLRSPQPLNQKSIVVVGACRTCRPVLVAVLRRNKRRMNGAKKSQESGYQRVVLKNSSPYHYMKVSLELEDESTKVSAVELKHFIITGLKSLFGEVGAALDFDVLKYSEDTRTAFLRVPSRGLVNLWSSLTLLGSYQSQACAFRVLQVSSFLLPLTGNSRELLLD